MDDKIKNKVLVIAPHMDDEVLGCAATILKHKERGDQVSVIFVAHRVYNHIFDKKNDAIEHKHALDAKKILGYDKVFFMDLSDERLDGCVQNIIIGLEEFTAKTRPNIAYLPFRGDNNQDHRAVFDAARVIFRPLSSHFIDSLYMYEVPSSTEQSPPLIENAFMPNLFVDITDFMPKKIAAYRCYKTEKKKYPHPRSEKAIEILAKKRGMDASFKYAEAFMVLRKKWR